MKILGKQSSAPVYDIITILLPFTPNTVVVLLIVWRTFRFTVLAEINVCPPCPSVPAPNLYKHGPYQNHLQLSACLMKPEGCWVHYRSLPWRERALEDNPVHLIVFWSCGQFQLGFCEYGHRVPYDWYDTVHHNEITLGKKTGLLKFFMYSFKEWVKALIT